MDDPQLVLPRCVQEKEVRVLFHNLQAVEGATERSDTNMNVHFPNTFGQPLAIFLNDSGDDQIHCRTDTDPRIGIIFSGKNFTALKYIVLGVRKSMNVYNLNGTIIFFRDGFTSVVMDNTTDFDSFENEDLSNGEQNVIAEDAWSACNRFKLDGLVFIGGAESNTSAAKVAEYFVNANCETKVVGIPVSSSGEVKNEFVETNVGFDTLCEDYSLHISDVWEQAASEKKDYHFICLIGGSAVALDCTQRTRPNMVTLPEEVEAFNFTLEDIVNQICEVVTIRRNEGKNHGVVLLPAHLSAIIPELSDFHGIEMAQFLGQLVENEMKIRSKEAMHTWKFTAIYHCIDYQVRKTSLTRFDRQLAYVLGYVCHLTILLGYNGFNGYMPLVTNLKDSFEFWNCGAIPIAAMMSLKQQSSCPGLHPALVDLKGEAYQIFKNTASEMSLSDKCNNQETSEEYARPPSLLVDDLDWIGNKFLSNFLELSLEGAASTSSESASPRTPSEMSMPSTPRSLSSPPMSPLSPNSLLVNYLRSSSSSSDDSP